MEQGVIYFLNLSLGGRNIPYLPIDVRRVIWGMATPWVSCVWCARVHIRISHGVRLCVPSTRPAIVRARRSSLFHL